jgi:hypothetical protein
MATELQIHDILTYIGADLDVVITPERRAVWYDQFKGIEPQELAEAARVLLTRKVYGKFPKVADMWEALAELRTPANSSWAEAWDDWVTIARRYGYYQQELCRQELQRKNPAAEKALGTMLSEWFTTKLEDVPTFRAQFRQRYDSLKERQEAEMKKPQPVLHSPLLKSLLEQTTKRLGQG